MHTLSIDIETYCALDLAKVGVHKYAAHSSFEVLLVAVSVDDAPVRVLTGDELLRDAALCEALRHPLYTKTAWNAAFERTCLAAWLMDEMPAEQWDCTMRRAAMAGLPLSLDAAAKALGGQQKEKMGKDLIRLFSAPCKPTKANGQRTRNTAQTNPEQWAAFVDYCAQDVRTETDIRRRLIMLPAQPERETAMWVLDQKINDYGVRVDLDLVANALAIDAENKADMAEQAADLTGLENPGSVAQLRQWVGERTGQIVQTLTKEDVKTLRQEASGLLDDVLRLRQELSKTSTKKYDAIAQCAGADARVRGLLQYYGAGRTGRWAGRLVQVQNLPKNTMPAADLDVARDAVRGGDIETLCLLFDSVSDTLAQLIRTAFVATPGHRLIAADFSAIEARVLSWLAGEKWRMEVFASHGKIYEASASQMFGVPIELIGKSSPLRGKGKVAELALGYQGGAGALIQMGALEMGLGEAELPGLVGAWREANPQIVRLWRWLERLAIMAVETRETQIGPHGVRMRMADNNLLIYLPSGRYLTYVDAQLRPAKFGGLALTYMGMDQKTKQRRRQDTYGGKLTENLTQAIARDCLAMAMLRLDKAGYKIAMHVHDEVVLDVPYGFGSTEQVDLIMSRPISWALGLSLTAESYETHYYKKD